MVQCVVARLQEELEEIERELEKAKQLNVSLCCCQVTGGAGGCEAQGPGGDRA